MVKFCDHLLANVDGAVEEYDGMELYKSNQVQVRRCSNSLGTQSILSGLQFMGSIWKAAMSSRMYCNNYCRRRVQAGGGVL